MEQRRTPTVRAVAAAAGVSTTVVSRVLNRRAGGVSDETRARVEQVISDLGYRPNRNARSLRTSRQYRVSLVVADTSPEFLADPFTTYVAAGLSNVLSEADYGLLVQRLDLRSGRDVHLERAHDGDAVTLVPSGPKERRLALVERCRELGLPLLVFQDPLEIAQGDVCVVRQDDRGGGFWLGQRMRSAGIEDVLAVMPSLAWPAAEERIAGLRAGLGDAVGVVELAVDETAPAAVAEALDDHLDAHTPQAIFANNDQLAAQAIAALGRRGLEVPRDVRVAGFNAFPVTGAVHPPLTTVRSPAFRLGEAAARLVVRRLEADDFEARELVLPVTPVEGVSL